MSPTGPHRNPLHIVPATAEMREDTTCVVRDAFWDVYAPGATEHLVWERALDGHADAVDGLTLVAMKDGEVRGCILGTRAWITPAAATNPARDAKIPALVMGPVAVGPHHQRKGVGSLLVLEFLTRARARREKGVFVFGDPCFYGRFGFRSAAHWAITDSEGGTPEHFMGLELQAGDLAHSAGTLTYSDLYTVASAPAHEHSHAA